MDSIKKADEPQACEIVPLTTSYFLSQDSLLVPCLDVVEETHQVITDPKSHCAAHHLRETQREMSIQ